MRVLVFGAAGQLGAVIVRRFTQAGHDVVRSTRQDVDLRRDAEIFAAITRARPNVIVNCAAFNDVDGAETQQETALAVNAFAVRALARGAGEAGATLVHYSTDFVFDGETDQPYTEQDRPHPQSVYACSKYLGECFAPDAGQYYTLRVESLFGGPAARSSIDRIVADLSGGRQARVFTDRTVSPSYVEDVATATERLLLAAPPFGIYHCVNSGYAPWFELGLEIAGHLGAVRELVAGMRTTEVPLRARRPRFAALSNHKLAAIGVLMPSWQDALARYLVVRTHRTSSP